MTSKFFKIISACLVSVFCSMAFVGVAYADNSIWHESVNLYNMVPFESYNANNSQPYIINLTGPQSFYEPGEEYSISYDIDSTVTKTRMIRVQIDGRPTYNGYGDSNPITFQVPEEYDNIQIYISSTEYIGVDKVSNIMLNKGEPLPYEPYYSGFRFDFGAIAQTIGQYVQPIILIVLPYIFVMIALIIGISAGLRIFRKTAT